MSEATALAGGLDGAREVALLREMVRIRRFEEKCAALYGETKIRGFLHLYVGEEAVAVGVLRAATPEDAVVATYREHGHALARGVPMGAIMAEMYGKLEGCSRGRGGSMHLFDAARRFCGGNAIVAGGLPVAPDEQHRRARQGAGGPAVIEFRMPSLGAEMERGTLLEWRVAPGDRVRRGDVVAVVDTDKAAIEVECWQEGTVEKIVVAVGDTVPVGAVLALLRDSDLAAEPPSPAPVAAAVPPARVRATPLARRLSAERGIDLTSISGSGPGGAITGGDLPGAAAAGMPTARSAAEPARVNSMRRAIAAAVQRAKREIPHYYLETAIDFGVARTWLDAANRDRPIEQRLLPPALLLRAVALALREAPELNGFWADGELAISESIHLGFAVSLRGGGGLLAPVLRDVDRQGVGEIMAALRDRVARARAGRLRSSELSGATCTVTSLGDQGVDKVYGIIYPPQVALVGFGAIREQPWARDGWLALRPVITATLSADHRASDGLRGARFLARVRSLLERPEEL